MQNCSRYIENYCFKHKNLVGCRGLRPLTPTGALPPGIIGSRSRVRHGCVFDPTFLYPPRPRLDPECETVKEVQIAEYDLYCIF